MLSCMKSVSINLNENVRGKSGVCYCLLNYTSVMNMYMLIIVNLIYINVL